MGKIGYRVVIREFAQMVVLPFAISTPSITAVTQCFNIIRQNVHFSPFFCCFLIPIEKQDAKFRAIFVGGNRILMSRLRSSMPLIDEYFISTAIIGETGIRGVAFRGRIFEASHAPRSNFVVALISASMVFVSREIASLNEEHVQLLARQLGPILRTKFQAFLKEI
jgi:hypothetical protein